MANIEGIDRVTYGVEDIANCRRFFLDWGLKLVREGSDGLDFETLNGCEVFIRKSDDPSLPPAVEQGPTLRQVIWGVRAGSDLNGLRAGGDFRAADGLLSGIDPNGVGLGFRVSRKRTVG